MVFWGPPGTGKTTLARMVAAESGLNYIALSAVMAGVKDVREAVASLDVEQRLKDVEVEVNQGLTRDQAIQESKRCMSCGYCFDCEKCWMFCQDSAVIKPPVKGDLYEFNLGNCTGCKKCAEECPCGFIDMV